MSATWILGASGQLGFYLCERLGGDALPISRDLVDLNNTPSIGKQLAALSEPSPPKMVINASAYNQVDKAETNQEQCWALNVRAPKVVSEWCHNLKIPFLHFSTDFVYSGESSKIWTEADVANPINFYGQSKLAGENEVLKANPLAAVVRTSWVYSHRRDNFVLAILKRARTQNSLSVVDDQLGSPTYADNLADSSLRLLQHPQFLHESHRVWHICDAGHVSRFDFARAILAMASEFEPALKNVTVEPIHTAALAQQAPRPLNTRLSLEKAHRFGLEPKDWQVYLKQCLERYYATRG